MGPTVLTVLCMLGMVAADMTFSVSDCAVNRETELLAVPRVRLSPHPILIPGDLTIDGELRLNRMATGSLSLDVKIERYVGFLWITVPCISGVGSCKYADACEKLMSAFGGGNGTASCPRQLVDNNVPCTCPIQQGTFSLQGAVFSIPELSGLYSWLAEGDYRVTAKLIDNASGSEVACQHLEATIADGHEPCSGFLCSIFG